MRQEKCFLIGNGAFGDIYKDPDDTEFCYKAPVREREANILKELHHPHIVKFVGYDYYDDADKKEKILKMRRYSRDLFSHLEKNGFQLTINEVVKVMRQLLGAVAFMHGKGFLHRDIKPENIMVQFDDRGDLSNIYLGDFGATIAVGSSNQPDAQQQGTEKYLSPEMLISGLSGRSRKTDDAWACGVVATVCKVGRYPFDTPEDTKKVQFCEGFEQDCSKLPEWFRDYLFKATFVREEERWSVESVLSTYFSDADSNLERGPALKKQKC